MDNLVGVLIISGIANAMVMTPLRTTVSNKMKVLSNATGLPEWNAWRLAILEPVLTTLLAIVGGFLATGVYVWQYMFALPMLNMLMFTWLIKRYGAGCQRGRLAITVLLTRFFLLLLAFFLFMGEIWGLSAPLIVIALIIRHAFMLYKNHVTPTLAEYEREQASENIRIPAIEDGLGGLDLWNEQVALIERLKAEEGTAEASLDQASAIADPLVAEKNITVGRARELL